VNRGEVRWGEKMKIAKKKYAKKKEMQERICHKARGQKTLRDKGFQGDNKGTGDWEPGKIHLSRRVLVRGE